ncbi:MAG: hypothetical protein D6776_07720 [Planctomycetota bacterium]|nr:MAG: hypothetical protein D6776_07720 [Planctomycetota bacterium]
MALDRRWWVGLCAALWIASAGLGCASSTGHGGGSGGTGAAVGSSGAGGPAAGTGGVASAPSATASLDWRPFDASFVPPAPRRWRHWTSALVAAGQPEHRGYDVVIARGRSAQLRAKFQYGALYKDLEHEDVGVWVRSAAAAGWQHVADAETDGEGRVSLPLPASLANSPGVHFVKWVVYGDLTVADATVQVLDGTRPAVVFDIDGTLTTDDEQALYQLLGSWLGAPYDPLMFPDADYVARQLALAGHEIVYLTARPYFLERASRRWLEAKGFPRGAVFTSESAWRTLRNAAEARAFKRAELDALRQAGLDWRYAFGNAVSDIEAYERAGIPKAGTWIIGPHAGEQGTQALGAYRDLFGSLVPPR